MTVPPSPKQRASDIESWLRFKMTRWGPKPKEQYSLATLIHEDELPDAATWFGLV